LGQQGGGGEGGGAGGQQANEGGGIDSASSRVWGRARPLASGSRTASTPTTEHVKKHLFNEKHIFCVEYGFFI
jgi:hypothetical protein